MADSRVLKLTVILVLVGFIAAWGVPSYTSVTSMSGAGTDAVLQEGEQAKPQEETKPQEQDKTADKKDEGTWMDERLREGDDLMDVLGVTDLMPSTFELFLLWLFPVIIVIGIVFLIVILSKRKHQRTLAMIEKGAFKEEDIAKYKPKSYNWRLIVALIGLVLVLGGVGVSLFMVGQQGIQKWYWGVIPTFVGAAFLIFNRIYYKNKE